MTGRTVDYKNELISLRYEFVRQIESRPVATWPARLFRVVNAAIDTQFFDHGDRARDAGRAKLRGCPVAGEDMAELEYQRTEFVRRVEYAPVSNWSPELLRVVHAAIDMQFGVGTAAASGGRPNLRVVR